MKRRDVMRRSRIDTTRVAASLSRPGIDPRTWIAMARVDEDPDGTVWDAELGWLADVTLVGGTLDGEGPVLARMPSSGQGPGVGQYAPPRQGCLVLVAIPDGDPNNDCIILGQLHDESVAAATKVNGVDITEAFAQQTHILVFPGEDVDAEFRHVRLTVADKMVLGVAAAAQQAARGTALVEALVDLANALSKFSTDAASPPGGFGEVTATAFAAAAVVLKAKVAAFTNAAASYTTPKILVP